MFVTNALAASDPTEGTHSETGAEHGAGHGEGGGAFPPFDPSTFASQLLWLAISFGLFYLFMQKAVVPRIGSILENRRDRIAQDLDEANRLKTEADEAIAAYEQELAEARNKAGDIAKTARDKAAASAEKERAAVEADLAAKLAESEKTIADTKAKALSEVSGIAQETTGAIVEQLIGASLSESEIADAVAAASKS